MPGFEQWFDPQTGAITWTTLAEDGSTFDFSIGPTTGSDDGGFQFEFPDGSGGRLVLKFVPLLDTADLLVKGGRPGGTMYSTTVNLS